MEWRDCDKDPPEEDGQRVRVLINMEVDMFYLPSCKKCKWVMANSEEQEQEVIGWKPIEGAQSYYNVEGVDGMA
ncbi:hypothetical protein LCGC14_0456670 [marine sediment metagenome]|uniref:Uncharacterized protein n=1 Tax=marine sediment metagenome TaxID=412755 RepID=A0A0F9SG86_9ZZZZ